MLSRSALAARGPRLSATSSNSQSSRPSPPLGVALAALPPPLPRASMSIILLSLLIMFSLRPRMTAVPTPPLTPLSASLLECWLSWESEATDELAALPPRCLLT